MAKYIDADNLKKFIEDGLNYKGPDPRKQFGHDAIEILAEIEYAPAADVEPVRHERWVYGGCSHCGSPWLCNDIGEPVLSPYCPNCGAKMDRTEVET